MIFSIFISNIWNLDPDPFENELPRSITKSFNLTVMMIVITSDLTPGWGPRARDCWLLTRLRESWAECPGPSLGWAPPRSLAATRHGINQTEIRSHHGIKEIKWIHELNTDKAQHSMKAVIARVHHYADCSDWITS